MAPYFQSEFLTLYQGNCLQLLPELPDESVDALITDPPYCSGAATLTGKRQSPAEKYQNSGTMKHYPEMLGDARDQRSFTHWMAMWLCECWRILKNGAPVLIFTDWRQLPSVTDVLQIAGFSWRGIVVWHKPGGRPMLGEFRHDTEFIVFAAKGALSRQTKQTFPGMFSIAVNAKHKMHVVGKPLELMLSLMPIVQENGVILDPFAGGGTTALAAKKTGRSCICMELSPEYAQITVERLKTA